MLVGAVVVHDPDFFRSVAGADEGDLRARDAVGAGAQFADDFVGELMGEFPYLRVGGGAAIDLGDDGLRRRITHVEEPRLDRDVGGFGEIAEGDEVGVGWGIGPGEVAEFGWLRRRLWRIEAGADEVDDTAELEVVTDNLGEERGVIFGLVGAWGEVGDGEAGLFVAEAGAGAEPFLGRGDGWRRESDCQ